MGSFFVDSLAFEVQECLIANWSVLYENFAFAEGVWKAVIGSFHLDGVINDFSESLELSVVHFMVLGEFDDDWKVNSVFFLFQVNSGVDFAKSSLWKIFGNFESIIDDKAKKIVNNRKFAVLSFKSLPKYFLKEFSLHLLKY